MRVYRLLALAALISACDSPSVPERLLTDVYDYRLRADGLKVLRWPIGTTVRVYVAADAEPARTSALESAFENGASGWNAAALYGEVRLERTTDLAEADAVLLFSSTLPPVETSNCSPGGGSAATTLCLDPQDPTRLAVFPLRNGGGGQVKFLVTIRSVNPLDVEAVRRLVAHELGHVLGIAQHSSRQTDLMFPETNLTRAEPSPADRATLHVLYHSRPDITP
ncbi:MAG TPA: hypothetical protein VFZ04_22490 [Longimicrobiales bacterium]